MSPLFVFGQLEQGYARSPAYFCDEGARVFRQYAPDRGQCLGDYRPVLLSAQPLGREHEGAHIGLQQRQAFVMWNRMRSSCVSATQFRAPT